MAIISKVEVASYYMPNAESLNVVLCNDLQSGTVTVRASKTGIETKLENKTRAPASLLYGSFVAAKKDGDNGMARAVGGDGRYAPLMFAYCRC